MTRSGECSAAGFAPPGSPANTKGIPEDTLYLTAEILREEHRSRTIVLVRLVEPVRVELDLIVVEVEDRGVVETIVGIRIFAFTLPCHRSLKVIITILLLNCIQQQLPLCLVFALSKDKQYLFIAARFSQS